MASAGHRLEAQLEALQEEFPHCRVAPDRYHATLRVQTHLGFLTLELQLQPEFRATAASLQLLGGGEAAQLHHPWLGPGGEVEQRHLGPITWKRRDALQRAVSTIVQQFRAQPPTPAQAQAPPTYTALQQPRAAAVGALAPPSGGGAGGLPSYTALHPPAAAVAASPAVALPAVGPLEAVQPLANPPIGVGARPAGAGLAASAGEDVTLVGDRQDGA